MPVYTVKQILQAEHPPANDVEIRGWVRTKRDSKKFSFIELNDGSCMASLQIIAESSIDGYNDTVVKLTTGSSVAAVGVIVDSPGKGQKYEMQATKVTVYSIAPPEYPLQKKRHSFEYLREIAHLRPRTNTLGAVARVRSSLSHAIHTFFQDRGFVYVHTPIITASDCEGAGEMFRVTALDLENLPKTGDGQVDFSQDFFGKPASLTVSGQLEGEIYAMALGKVYTFGPTFRAENSNTSR
ncbi:MAG: asparagine--tRNA ligase, partial [Chitinivibrionales bacterium]|nr:asparagine--tRNA ligase [Chitinivibrionales bacterium]